MSKPPPGIGQASRALAFGVLMFGLGLAIFAATRLTGSAAPVATAPLTGTASVAPTTPSATASQAAPTPSPSPTAATLSFHRLIGQKLVVSMAGTTPSRALLGRVRRGEVGGVIVFGSNVRTAAQLTALSAALQAAARAGGQPPLLIMTDQEGGAIRRLPWAPPAAAATKMGETGDADVVRNAGAGTGRALAAVGINVNLAPVSDVPGTGQSFMRDMLRTFSSDPAVTSRLAPAFAEGLASQHVLATAKHFPGIGRVARNTDSFVETVRASRADLERDLAPFRAEIAAGVRLIMLSNATYTAWDAKAAAGWSHAIATTLLRDGLGFTGVSMTDGLDGTAVARKVAPVELATLAASAGTDLLLDLGPEARTAKDFDVLVARAEAGTIERGVLEASYDRILALKATLRD